MDINRVIVINVGIDAECRENLVVVGSGATTCEVMTMELESLCLLVETSKDEMLGEGVLNLITPEAV